MDCPTLVVRAGATVAVQAGSSAADPLGRGCCGGSAESAAALAGREVHAEERVEEHGAPTSSNAVITGRTEVVSVLACER